MKATPPAQRAAVSVRRLAGRHLEGLHADRRDEAGQHDTGKTNHYREQSRYDMSGRQITVTDGETGHKGEIKSVNDAPPLYVPDEKSRSDHCKKNPGEDRPERANKPKELYEEDSPDLPWSH
jgi:hypothetical protein